MSVTHGKPGNHHKAYHVAGFATCPWHQRAVKAIKALQDKGEAKLVDHTFETRDLYREWLFSDEGRQKFDSPKAQKHTSSPFVWLNDKVFIGGHDDTIAYINSEATQITDNVLGTRDEFMGRMQNDPKERTLAQATIKKYVQAKPPIAVGDDAPNVSFVSLDGKKEYKLYDLLQSGRPMVLNFGSCSWPPFRVHAEVIEKIAKEYTNIDFATFYIAEAHAADEWTLLDTANAEMDGKWDVMLAQNMNEKLKLAQDWVDWLNPTTPYFVDKMNDEVRTSFAAWPERLAVIGTDKKIVYYGKQGPWGYDPEELSLFLKEHYSSSINASARL